MRFADTNVLLYAVSRADDERAKAATAVAILEDRDLVILTQVLQEFYVQATRADRAHPLSSVQAAALVESFTRFRVQDITVPIVRAAVRTQARFTVSSWDGTIIEAARAAGCSELLSDDLSDGQDFDGVTVRNPFRDVT